MARFPFQYVNINGVPTLKSKRINVTDTSLDFTFNPDWDRNPNRGLLLIYLSEELPTGTTGTLPVRFTMAGTTSNVTVAGGDNLTVADIATPGVYLVYYDRSDGTLQLIG